MEAEVSDRTAFYEIALKETSSPYGKHSAWLRGVERRLHYVTMDVFLWPWKYFCQSLEVTNAHKHTLSECTQCIRSLHER